MWLVSTKCHNKPRAPVGRDEVTGFGAPARAREWLYDGNFWNKSDCNLVLTTSSGAVMMAPAIPPTLVKVESASDQNNLFQHSPPSKKVMP